MYWNEDIWMTQDLNLVRNWLESCSWMSGLTRLDACCWLALLLGWNWSLCTVLAMHSTAWPVRYIFANHPHPPPPSPPIKPNLSITKIEQSVLFSSRICWAEIKCADEGGGVYAKIPSLPEGRELRFYSNNSGMKQSHLRGVIKNVILLSPPGLIWQGPHYCI